MINENPLRCFPNLKSKKESHGSNHSHFRYASHNTAKLFTQLLNDRSKDYVKNINLSKDQINGSSIEKQCAINCSPFVSIFNQVGIECLKIFMPKCH